VCKWYWRRGLDEEGQVGLDEMEEALRMILGNLGGRKRRKE
jgi:hypothetical protein